MPRYDVIQLITEHASEHGVHQAITEDAKEVCAEIKSVRLTEYYTAYNNGLQPELVFKLAISEDYENERYIRYNGVKYQVIRTYLTDDGGIEITVQRSDVNA